MSEIKPLNLAFFDDYSEATAATISRERERLKIKSRMEVKGGVSP